jgi:hypothetical protein
MQMFLTGIIVLALVAFFARPALASMRGRMAEVPSATIAAPIYLAADKVDSAIKLDSTITGAIKLDFSSEKHDKWLVSSIKCDDVTVVATGERGIVATTKGNSVPGDPASCVYSMKVPSGVALSVYAQIGSAQSVGITSLDKLKKSDLLAQKLGPTNTIKGDSQFLKIKLSDSTNTLPLYLKLDT